MDTLLISRYVPSPPSITPAVLGFLRCSRRSIQDLVARFTLDSATEFLFGIDVGSIQAGLPYPPKSHVNNPTVLTNHPSTLFVEAFQEGQFLTSSRGNYGIDWPLKEFWKDKIKPLRRQMDVFLEPILAKALADKNVREDKTARGQEKLMEAETLLDHLVNQTQGQFNIIALRIC